MHIDGSKLEGGGQILRMASSLSCILQTPIEVSNIRANRSKPGLKAQHLTGLKLLKEMTGAHTSGLVMDSTKIEFQPQFLNGGQSLSADVETAGSVALLIQSVLPCSLFGEGPTEFVLRGGTNVELAPQIDYTREVLRKLCSKFGVEFDLEVKCRGFFPAGKGEVEIKVKPIKNFICPVQMMDRGEVTNMYGVAFVAGGADMRIAHTMANTAEATLRERTSVKIQIGRYKYNRSEAFGSGSGIVLAHQRILISLFIGCIDLVDILLVLRKSISLWAETSTGCVFGASAVGRRQIPPKNTGASAAFDMINALQSNSCVDTFAQDQIIILMALANGLSHIRTMKPTLHTQTAIHVAELMTQAKFNVIEEKESGTWIIECQGIGHGA